MSLKIRKLYNVLVVGGLLAACEKSHTQAAEPQPPAPAKAAAPVEAATPPAPIQSPPDKVEPAAEVATTTEPPAEPPKQTPPRKRPVPAKATIVPAEPPVGLGGGVRGWH